MIIKFPIKLQRDSSGNVRMKDINNQDFIVRHADGTCPTDEEYERMLAEAWGYWDVCSHFKLEAIV